MCEHFNFQQFQGLLENVDQVAYTLLKNAMTLLFVQSAKLDF